jgi:geranylgeranyl diphosphate synthase type I
MMASEDPDVVAAFRRFGYDLGIAFQIADDVKGSFWGSAESGKSVAGDIRKRKKTFPVVWAMQHAAPGDIARLVAIYQPTIRATDGSSSPDGDTQMSPDLVDEVLEILERSGARRHAEEEARRYRDVAIARARSLPVPQEGLTELRELVESMISP